MHVLNNFIALPIRQRCSTENESSNEICNELSIESAHEQDIHPAHLPRISIQWRWIIIIIMIIIWISCKLRLNKGPPWFVVKHVFATFLNIIKWNANLYSGFEPIQVVYSQHCVASTGTNEIGQIEWANGMNLKAAVWTPCKSGDICSATQTFCPQDIRKWVRYSTVILFIWGGLSALRTMCVIW